MPIGFAPPRPDRKPLLATICAFERGAHAPQAPPRPVPALDRDSPAHSALAPHRPQAGSAAHTQAPLRRRLAVRFGPSAAPIHPTPRHRGPISRPPKTLPFSTPIETGRGPASILFPWFTLSNLDTKVWPIQVRAVGHRRQSPLRGSTQRDPQCAAAPPERRESPCERTRKGPKNAAMGLLRAAAGQPERLAQKALTASKTRKNSFRHAHPTSTVTAGMNPNHPIHGYAKAAQATKAKSTIRSDFFSGQYWRSRMPDMTIT